MALFSSHKISRSARDHATDLIIIAFFFAMRSCEFAKAKKKGRTKMIRLGGIKFYSKDHKEIPHDDPKLMAKAVYVWVLFEAQKNLLKWESRTQMRSGDSVLCPVYRLVRAVQRVRRFVNGANDETPLCSVNCKPSHRSNFITNDFTRKFLREICQDGGGKGTFGFDSSEIGNKSIRSGAAMSLFLTNHSADKIMILGRWKSRAFLDYIRPQVAQWSSCFAKDMVSFETFFDLCSKGITKKKIQEPLKKHHKFPEFFLGSSPARMAG